MSKKPIGINKDQLKSVNVKNWSLGLVAAMKDPNSVVCEDVETVTIKDKFPKAKHHYLVLAKDNISSILALNKSHLPLLNHMKTVADSLCKKHNDSTFNVGYHSIPSMQRLHLHVISDDFVSPCLKTKVHWNSFTTKFFLSSEALIKLVEENGSVTRMSSEIHKELINTPLKCHKCNFTPKSMPDLKKHLLSHVK